MLKFTVSRDDHVYACFPDIAMCPDGTMVCVYRECMGHSFYPFSRMVVRRSFDEGRTWTDRQIIAEVVNSAEAVDLMRPWLEEDSLAGYEETRSRLTEDGKLGSGINCPRVICLQDGSLFAIVDLLLLDNRWTNWIWRSYDSGVTWLGPEKPDLLEGLVPSIVQLRDGDLLVGLAELTSPDLFTQFVQRSGDGGRTWSEPVFLPMTEAVEPDEVGYVELDDGTLVGFARNSVCEKRRVPSGAVKVISKDGGRTWAGPFDTWMVGCTGRPAVGLLRSGEVCVTYRCTMPNEMLAMHVMTQDAARFERLDQLVPRRPMPEDIPARLAQERGEQLPWYMRDYYPGRTIILDWDRCVHRDEGYTAWFQLASGDIYVVDYITDDAPLAQIRGYQVSRSDIILFPEGDMPGLCPTGAPFRAITQAMINHQIAENRLR
ncbi:MAG: sialidase family protein [Candidatus Latescibacterota bacterium]